MYRILLPIFLFIICHSCLLLLAIFRSSIHSFKLLSILLFKLSNGSLPLQETRIETSQYYLIHMHCCWVMITNKTNRQVYIRNSLKLPWRKFILKNFVFLIKIKDSCIIIWFGRALMWAMGIADAFLYFSSVHYDHFLE